MDLNKLNSFRTLAPIIVTASVIYSVVNPSPSHYLSENLLVVDISPSQSYSSDKSKTDVMEPNASKSIAKSISMRIIDEIQNLHDDWNGYNAPPIPQSVLTLCRDIVMILDPQPNIFPTARRTIQMEYELSDRSYLEFEIYPDHITVLEVPQRNYSSAIQKSIASTNYQSLSQIVSAFHGGYNEWANRLPA